MAEKKTKGRMKRELRKIENKSDRLIAFSRRRSGIHKKLIELVSLCGVDVGFLVFSKAGNPFTFASPSFESVATRFMSGDVQRSDNPQSIVEAHMKVRVNQLRQQCDQLTERLEAVNQHANSLKQLRKGKDMEGEWWQTQIEELDVEELVRMYELFKDLLECLRGHILRKEGAGPSNLIYNTSDGKELNNLASPSPYDGRSGPKE